MRSIVKIGFENQIGFVGTKPKTIFWGHNERFCSQISIAQYGALWWEFCHAVNEDKLFQFCWGTRLNINITPAPPGRGHSYPGGGTITGSTPHCPAFICTISRFFPFFDIFMAVFFSPRSYNSFFSYPNVSLICTFLAFPIMSFSGSILEEGETSMALKFSRNGRAGRGEACSRRDGKTGRSSGTGSGSEDSRETVRTSCEDTPRNNHRDWC